MGGLDLLAMDLRKTKDPAEFTSIVAAYAKKQPAGIWLTDGAWDHEQWTPADAADEGAARPGHRRPSDLPPAAGRTHDGLQQPRAEAGRRRQEHARPAGRRHRARLDGQSDRRPEGRSDEPRLEGPAAADEGRDRRGPQGGRRARREERRDLRAGSAGRPTRRAGLGRDAKRGADRPRQLPAVDHDWPAAKKAQTTYQRRLAADRRREGIHGRRARRRDRRHVRGVLRRSGQHRQVRRRGHPALEDRGTDRRRRRRRSPGRGPRDRRQGDRGAPRHLSTASRRRTVPRTAASGSSTRSTCARTRSRASPSWA